MVRVEGFLVRGKERSEGGGFAVAVAVAVAPGWPANSQGRRRKKTEEEEDEDEEEVGGDGFLRKGGEDFVWFSEIRGCSDDL